MHPPTSTDIRPCKHGHVSTRDKRGKCLECIKNWEATFRKTRPDYRKEYNRGYRTAKPEKAILQLAKDRARRDGYACTITEADIVIPQFCPLLGIRLERGKGVGGMLPSSPTLDKIRPDLGYVPGNVWVISHRANSIKSDATLAELRTLVGNLATRYAVPPWKCS